MLIKQISNLQEEEKKANEVERNFKTLQQELANLGVKRLFGYYLRKGIRPAVFLRELSNDAQIP
jgi:hypothetical protein